MTTWADHNYKAENIDLIDDLREHGNGLGERREDILDSMLNLILNHKKEIQKIPSCTTLRGAQAWCDKRPGSGFRAHMADIGGDPENEVVVYDKAGKPVIVNGYRIKPSDYGIRKLYREAVDKDPEAMIGTSMREWVTDLEKFKKYTKANKDTFRRWFLNNIMSGDRKEVFKKAWVSEATIITNLIKDDIQLDGSDIQDGIVFLLSVANLKDKEPVEVVYNGTSYQFTFRQLLVDKDAAAKFNAVIKDKKNQNAKVLKRRLDKWKKNAEKSTKAYFQDERAKKLFFEDAAGKAQFLEGLKAGLPNATSAGSAAFQKQNVSSPVKNVPVVEPVDEGVSADDVEFERFEKEDDDEPPIPAIDKGQRKMTDYFTSEE